VKRPPLTYAENHGVGNVDDFGSLFKPSLKQTETYIKLWMRCDDGAATRTVES